MIIHVLRIISCILTLFLIKVPMMLLGLIVVPIALVFKINDKRIASNKISDQRLPKWASWWDNGDNLDRYYGLNGDINYQTKFLLKNEEVEPRHLGMILDIYEEQGNKIDTKWNIFKMRFMWLAIRNPANYFQNRVLGVKSEEITSIVRYYNNTKYNKIDVENLKSINLNSIPEVSDWYNEGIRHVEVKLEDDSTIFEYYIVKKIFNTSKCIRIRLGHKIGHTPLKKDKEYIQFAGAITLATYEGK